MRPFRIGAMRRLLLPLLMSAAEVPPAHGDASQVSVRDRKVFIWLNPGFWMNLSWHTQTVNTSWQIDGTPIIDGVYLMGAATFEQQPGGDVVIAMNETSYEACCGEYVRNVTQLGIEVHAFLGTVPDRLLEDPGPAMRSGLALAKKYGWRGYNIDDESECAPRADLANFTKWVEGLGVLQDGLAAGGLELSVDVQAVWGIEPGPYVRHAPCQRAPWDWRVDPGLVSLLSAARIGRWVSMDTYLPQSGRFAGQVEWWTRSVGAQHFSVGVEGGGGWENNTDAFVARMQSVWSHDVRRFAFWMGVINEEWLPWLYRWKTGCAGCPHAENGGSMLACFELSADCGEPRPSTT